MGENKKIFKKLSIKIFRDKNINIYKLYDIIKKYLVTNIDINTCIKNGKERGI